MAGDGTSRVNTEELLRAVGEDVYKRQVHGPGGRKAEK